MAAGIALAWGTSGSWHRERSTDREILIKDQSRTGSAESTAPNSPIADHQVRLLDLAFTAATALPVHPHVKNRSRAQEEVVAACLELEQPRRGLEYTQGIENWRRGSCYADYAFYCAEKGTTAGVQHHLELALRIADDNAKVETSQDWQRDRIRVKIARTYLVLGQTDRAAQFAAGVEESEVGGFATLSVRLADASQAARQLEAMDGALATGTMDQVVNALESCVELFGRFFQDRELRSQIEGKIRSSWKKVPVEFGVNLFMKLAGVAVEHKDPAKALELVEEARRILEGSKWLPEDRIRLAARLATSRHRAGEREQARADADAALATFASERNQIVDIYRAAALRPVAEAFHAMGDSRAALDVYRKAVEEGVGNPNSRPRAEDLVATCLSMARNRVEPDAALWARLQQIREGLADPW